MAMIVFVVLLISLLGHSSAQEDNTEVTTEPPAEVDAEEGDATEETTAANGEEEEEEESATESEDEQDNLNTSEASAIEGEAEDEEDEEEEFEVPDQEQVGTAYGVASGTAQKRPPRNRCRCIQKTSGKIVKEIKYIPIDPIDKANTGFPRRFSCNCRQMRKVTKTTRFPRMTTRVRQSWG